MKLHLRLMLLVALVMAGITAHAKSGTKVLRLGTDHAYDFVTTVALRNFAEMVEKETGGSVKIDVYDSGQLGMEKACIEQVQFGALDLTKTSISPLSEFIPNLGVLNLPYLFRDLDHMWTVMTTDIGNGLLAEAESAGMVALCWIDAGSRCFYGKNPLREVADLKGLKIRVPESRMMMAMIEALGGHATPMPGGDIYSALQTGVCDAAENNIPRYLDMSHQEVAPYLTVDRHNIVPEVLLISKRTMDSLSDNEREAINRCAAALQEDMIVNWAKAEEEVLESLAQKGVTTYYPEPETIAGFRQACQPVYDEYSEYKDLAAAIEAVK